MKEGSILVLIRHGQSQWNKENRFTGWIDIDLCEEGIKECRRAAEKLKGIRFDIAFTSGLRRGWRSLEVILETLGLKHISVIQSQALNERHYGELQGMNKDEARKRFGAEQIHRWRRGFYDRPPEGENLEDVYNRAVAFFTKRVLPELHNGRDVIIVAHGNSLRALVAYLEGLGEEEILNLEIPTGELLFYHTSGNTVERSR